MIRRDHCYGKKYEIFLNHDVYFFLFCSKVSVFSARRTPLWPRFCFFFVQFFVFPWIASPFTCIFLSFWQVCFCSAKGDTPLDPRFFLKLWNKKSENVTFKSSSLKNYNDNDGKSWLVSNIGQFTKMSYQSTSRSLQNSLFSLLPPRLVC